VECATLERVDWFNNRRLLEPVGNIPPAEAEARFYAALETQAVAARPKQIGLGKPGAVQVCMQELYVVESTDCLPTSSLLATHAVPVEQHFLPWFQRSCLGGAEAGKRDSATTTSILEAASCLPSRSGGRRSVTMALT